MRRRTLPPRQTSNCVQLCMSPLRRLPASVRIRFTTATLGRTDGAPPSLPTIGPSCRGTKRQMGDQGDRNRNRNRDWNREQRRQGDKKAGALRGGTGQPLGQTPGVHLLLVDRQDTSSPPAKGKAVWSPGSARKRCRCKEEIIGAGGKRRGEVEKHKEGGMGVEAWCTHRHSQNVAPRVLVPSNLRMTSMTRGVGPGERVAPGDAGGRGRG